MNVFFRFDILVEGFCVTEAGKDEGSSDKRFDSSLLQFFISFQSIERKELVKAFSHQKHDQKIKAAANIYLQPAHAYVKL